MMTDAWLTRPEKRKVLVKRTGSISGIIAGVQATLWGLLELGAMVLHYIGALRGHEFIRPWVEWAESAVVYMAVPLGGMFVVCIAWLKIGEPMLRRLNDLRRLTAITPDDFYWWRWREAAPQMAIFPRLFCDLAAMRVVNRRNYRKAIVTMLECLLGGTHNAVKRFCPDARCFLRYKATSSADVLATFATHVDRTDAFLADYFTHLGNLRCDCSLQGLVYRANLMLILSDVQEKDAEEILRELRVNKEFDPFISAEHEGMEFTRQIRRLQQCHVTGLALAPICLSRSRNGSSPTTDKPVGVLEVVSFSEKERLIDNEPVRLAIRNTADWAALCVQLPYYFLK